MKYLLTLFRDETSLPDISVFSSDQQQAKLPPYIEFQRWCAANRMTVLAGKALAPAEAATTLRHGSSKDRLISDGPFLEMKEQIGGFCLIECDNADIALTAAKEVPFLQACELRPVVDYGIYVPFYDIYVT